jgi:hypothetical protein
VGANVAVVDYLTVEEGLTDGNGDYVTGDLAFPTPFLGSQWYEIFAGYWTATNTASQLAAWDTPQPIVLVLNLYEGQGQEGGTGTKTLTITAIGQECNHIIAINVGQQTSVVFASFPATLHFNPEDQISLEAFPQSGYTFDDWGDGNNANPYVWYPGSDASVTANFHYVGLPPTSTEQVINVPKPVVVFGNIFVPETDIIECTVHLGATKEVSSFEVKLQNWGKKYSQSGWLPIQLGATGGIGICRIPYNPNVLPMISLKVEHIEYQVTGTETYALISGRCWGERLFRRTVTKKYVNCKGETIVKDLLDNYVGISHTRNGYELVENTSTTYTELDYNDTPVWDILQYIAQSADYNGVIGFDFRVAPDGRFEFFRKNSRSVVADLTDSIEESTYSKDISAVRNKITIWGASDKSYPLDKDGFTEILHPPYGDWTFAGGSGGSGNVAQDSTNKAFGTSSVKVHLVNDWYGMAKFTFKAGMEPNCELFPTLNLCLYIPSTFEGSGVAISLIDDTGKQMVAKPGVAHDAQWNQVSLKVGSKYADEWLPGYGQSGFHWNKIVRVQVSINIHQDLSPGNGDYWIDGLYFGGMRYCAVVEDYPSQALYGLREFVDTDDELYSDNECNLRAQAILDYMKDPAEHLTAKSSVIDYGTTLILAGDKVHVELPNENIDEDFRVISAEYFVDGQTQELEITLELGREAVLLADYMYALKSKINKVNRLKVTS